MVSTYVWTTRCIPAFSICAIFLLLLFALIVSPFGAGEHGKHDGKATTAQLILSGYTVLCHILSIVFPVRVCYAIRDLLKNMRKAAAEVFPMRVDEQKEQSIMAGKGSMQYPVPLFVVILPAYKEEVATLVETLRVLSSHAQARTSYHVRIIDRQSSRAASSCWKTLG